MSYPESRATGGGRGRHANSSSDVPLQFTNPTQEAAAQDKRPPQHSISKGGGRGRFHTAEGDLPSQFIVNPNSHRTQITTHTHTPRPKQAQLVEAHSTDIQFALQQAHTGTIPQLHRKATTPWTTEATCRLLDERDSAKQAQDLQREAQLHRDTRKAARADKAQWLKDQVQQASTATHPKQKWEWIKRLRKGYTAKPTAFKDLQGNIVNMFQRAQTFAT